MCLCLQARPFAHWQLMNLSCSFYFEIITILGWPHGEVIDSWQSATHMTEAEWTNYHCQGVIAITNLNRGFVMKDTEDSGLRCYKAEINQHKINKIKIRSCVSCFLGAEFNHLSVGLSVCWHVFGGVAFVGIKQWLLLEDSLLLWETLGYPSTWD